MNFTKLSLAALAVMGIASSASALENVKVDGSVKLWYQTMDTDTNVDSGLFKQDGASGDLVAKLRATGDLTKNVGFGTTLYAVTTLGLENNLVRSEAIGQMSNSGGDGLNGSDRLPMWLGEAYMTYKAGKTIVKIGRQELDTPLAFTETWNAAPNTFEAAVVINQDIPDVTLVGAYVSRGNGYTNNHMPADLRVPATSDSLGVNGATVANGSFYNYHANANVGDTQGGAYAAAAVIKAIPNAVIHPVYYDILDTANAFWVDASYNVPNIVKIEGLYANVNPIGATKDALDLYKAAVHNDSTDAWAAQLSGAVVGVNLAASYSSVGEGYLPVANTATGFKKTKIYTASICSDGEVAGKPDTTAWKVSASTKLAGFDLGASYASYSVGKNNSRSDWFGKRTGEYDPSEVDLSVGTKVGDIGVVAYYINQSEFNTAKQDRQAVRVIATINF